MLGLGWTEMLVIGVLALIVIGPKDLPVVMNRIGKVVGQVRRMGSDFQREINRSTGLDEVRNLRNSITGPLQKTSDEIRRDFNAMTPSGAKPSGVLKPTDPTKESVVDEIKAQAGMSEPAAPRSADETAKAAGFKPAGPAPKSSTATFGKPAGTPAAPSAPASAGKVASGTKADGEASPEAAAATASKAATKSTGKSAGKTASKASGKPAAHTEMTATKPAAAKKTAAKRSAAPKTATAAEPENASIASSDTMATGAKAKEAAKTTPARRAPAKPKAGAPATASKAEDE